MLVPGQRPIAQHLSQPQPLRLPAVENGLNNVWGETGEWEQTTDIRVRHALLLRKVCNRPRPAALNSPPPQKLARRRDPLQPLALASTFAHDGWLEMTNNAAERAIRPLALGRKNYLLVGSDAGVAAQRSSTP